ncbi:hypothetical protein [Alphaentomopoxvirus acuprea]|uniref:Uncharacterized protein n=1 Tax=Alphaentomopoxvirus acuprea TaxID=62099 RepID=W6JL93_9POXV|nr:hypothetical protein BA82_gp036 [Anomala cuprea entomopoxvirus]BAO49396.1 hypothetical protein [Anomala cuprea entomopoxvirus]
MYDINVSANESYIELDINKEKFLVNKTDNIFKLIIDNCYNISSISGYKGGFNLCALINKYVIPNDNSSCRENSNKFNITYSDTSIDCNEIQSCNWINIQNMDRFKLLLLYIIDNTEYINNLQIKCERFNKDCINNYFKISEQPTI